MNSPLVACAGEEAQPKPGNGEIVLFWLVNVDIAGEDALREAGKL